MAMRMCNVHSWTNRCCGPSSQKAAWQNRRQHCALASKNVGDIWSCIRQSIVSKSRRVILPLVSALERSNKSCVQF